MKKKFSEVYHLYCEAIEKSAQEKLGRPLTKTEQHSIWNTGSLLVLESLEREIARSQSIEEVITLLARQAQASKETLEKMLENLIEQVARLLQRSLSSEEEQELSAIQRVREAMRVAEKLNEVSLDEREFAFQGVLDNLKLQTCI